MSGSLSDSNIPLDSGSPLSPSEPPAEELPVEELPVEEPPAEEPPAEEPPAEEPPPVCSTDTVLADETSFSNWLNSDRSCPQMNEVVAAIKNGSVSSSGSTELSERTRLLKTLEKNLKTRQIDVEVANDRANMVKRPEMTTSYYDGWFPLNKPLKTSTIPILIGVATFLFISAIFIFLELFGLQTRITYLYYDIMTGSTKKPFPIMAITAFVFFVLSLYLYFR